MRKHGRELSISVGMKKDNMVNVQRRKEVKGAMLHAWTSYEKYAWGDDELQVCLLTSKTVCMYMHFLLKLVIPIYAFS